MDISLGAILGAIGANLCLIWFRLGKLEGRLGKKIENSNSLSNPKKKEEEDKK